MLSDNKKEKSSLSRKKIEIIDKSSPFSFSKKMLVDIIEPRVSEIFDQVSKELKKIGRQQLLPAGIVITGGGPCEIGVPSGIVGLDDDPSLATVCGLALSGADIQEGTDFSNMKKGLLDRVKKIFRIFIP